MKYPSLLFGLLFQISMTTAMYALSEESIKAAYLERFAMFIEWPNPIEQYNVCVYNDDAFVTTLERAYASRNFNNRPLNILSLAAGASSQDLSACTILYYRGSKPAQNSAQLSKFQKNSVLVVSDDKDDAKKGGMISFYLEKNAYRFVINQRNLTNAKLNASYKLLNFATVIDTVGQ